MKKVPTETSRALAALGLRGPLVRLTSTSLDERRVLGMWQSIERRARIGAAPRVLLAPRALALAASLALLLLCWSLWPSRSDAPPGPLLTASGQRFESAEAGAQGPERVAFADGSQIELAAGARLEGLAATASELVLLLRRGEARFSVTPGGPRRWLIEARGARVEVVGTVFSITSRPGVFAVQVESGVVLVRSALLADGVQRLSAGQALRLDVGQEPAAAEVEPEEGEVPEQPAGTSPEPAAQAGTSALEDRARSTERRPRARPAPAPARPLPARARAAESARSLWTRVDAARRASDAAGAARLLKQLIDEYPGDSQAGLAAYTLGVLQLEQLAAPRAAARRFRQALELGIAAGLRESCYLRQVEALRHAGDEQAAREVARSYLRSFPLGEHRDAMQGLVTSGSLGGPEGKRGGRGK